MPEIDYGAEIKWDVLVWSQSGPEYRQRHKDVEQLVKAGYRVAWAGATKGVPQGVEQLPWTHPEKLHEIASHAACVLCVDRRTDIDGYWSDRIWLALGMGCAVVWSRPVGVYDDLNIREPKGHWLGRQPGDLPIADYEDDPAWSVHYAIKNRESMGKRARQWVMQSHTIKHRCQQLIEKVNAELAAAKAICG